MEADRVKIRHSRGYFLAVGGEENVLAVEPAAVVRQPPGTLVHDTEAFGIAVMAGATQMRAIALGSHQFDLGRPGNDRHAEQAAECFAHEESARGCIVEDSGGMRCGGGRSLPPSIAIVDRHAAIDEHAV